MLATSASMRAVWSSSSVTLKVNPSVSRMAFNSLNESDSYSPLMRKKSLANYSAFNASLNSGARVTLLFLLGILSVATISSTPESRMRFSASPTSKP
jgi:hypothetical protein